MLKEDMAQKADVFEAQERPVQLNQLCHSHQCQLLQVENLIISGLTSNQLRPSKGRESHGNWITSFSNKGK